MDKDFQVALALLHSFFWDEAQRAFEHVAAKDPTCAMALWGKAMTLYRLWLGPTSAGLEAGRAALAEARAIGVPTERERDYIAAAEVLYQGSNEPPSNATTCHGPARGNVGRLSAYSAAMEQLARKYPKDPEASIFYALSLLSLGLSAPVTDPAMTNEKKAAGLLEKLLVQHRDHPGIAHYLIHAYDFPSLAHKGVGVARAYGKMAPDVPHAVHMPSHIFTRLGMWEESAESNMRAAEVARDYAASHHPGIADFMEVHSYDYAVYAYLQIGQDKKVKEIIERMGAIEKVEPPLEVFDATAYSFAASPVRYVLERRQWAEAAALRLRTPDFWAKFPFPESNIVFANAVGAARTGDHASAQKSVDRLRGFFQTIDRGPTPKLARYVEVEILVASAWVAQARGAPDDALKIMTEAVALSDRLEKPTFTPGAVLPAREQLGDLLLELKEPIKALQEFELALKTTPNRYYAVYGAARAAEAGGKAKLVRKYYGQLLKITKGGDGTRPELITAKKYLAAR